MVPPVNVHVHNYYTSGGHLCGFFGHSSFQYLNHLKCTCIYSLVATALPLLSVFCIYIPYLECLLFNMFLVFKNSYFVCTDMVLMMFIKQKLLRQPTVFQYRAFMYQKDVIVLVSALFTILILKNDKGYIIKSSFSPFFPNDEQS